MPTEKVVLPFSQAPGYEEVRIESSLLDPLKQYAEATGTTLDAAITEALQDYIDVVIPARIG